MVTVERPQKQPSPVTGSLAAPRKVCQFQPIGKLRRNKKAFRRAAKGLLTT
jgi:hypothetical protein